LLEIGCGVGAVLGVLGVVVANRPVSGSPRETAEQATYTRPWTA
jgi:hypothetical protein